MQGRKKMTRTPEELREYCRRVRIETLKMVYGAKSGHIGGSFSITETLVSLYLGGILRYDPQNPHWDWRDRVIYSKGHASPALYATLALAGYFPESELSTFRDLDSRLQGHSVAQNGPDGTPGVEFCGGSLGQGLSFGIGVARHLKHIESSARVVVIASEGDFMEGEFQEALLSAPKNWAGTLGVEPHPESNTPVFLDNLFLLLDMNGIMNDTYTEMTVPLENLRQQLQAKGWEVYEVARGNDISEVRQSLSQIMNERITVQRPIAILLYTRKGSGVSFMEMNPKFHGEPPSEDEFHRALSELGASQEDYNVTPKIPSARLFERGRKGTRDAFGDAVIEVMENNPRTWAIAADLAKSTRFDKIAKRFPERFLNVGPQEQNMMGIAAGLAAEGNTVFVSTFAVFAELAFERVRQQIAIPNLNVKMLLSHAGFSVGKDGKSAQSFEHIGLWRLLPNMRVIVPADYNEAKAAIRYAAETEGPFVVFASRENFPQLYDREEFTIGSAMVHGAGRDATIVACGLMVHFALEAARILEKEGLSVGVVNMASVKPLDGAALLEAARTSGDIVVAEEHSKIGGLTGAVCEFLSQNCPVPVETISINDTFGTSGDSDVVLERYGLTPENIVSAVRRVIERKQTK